MDLKEKKASLSRRDFLKQGFSVVAAGAAGLTALGAPAIISARNVNSRINFGMIGSGSRGCSILRAIRDHKESLVTDVCDIYPPHLEEGKKESGNDQVRTHEDWQKLIEQKDLDAVIVSTPLFLHVPMSIASLEAGKHVFSEKSMGLSMLQLNEMIRAADKHTDKIYMVGYQYRLSDALIEAKRLVDEGSIGRITQFYVHFDRNQTWRREVEDPAWEKVLNWRLYRAFCGGMLTEVVTHEIDQIIDILGSMPDSAAFYGQIMVYNDGREQHDSIMGTWQMDDGVIGVGTGHLSNSSQRAGWTLLGTHGTIECYDGTLKVYWEKEARHLDTFNIKHKFTKIELGQSLKTDARDPRQAPARVMEFPVDADYQAITAREFKHFYDCVLNGTPPRMDARSARLTSMAALTAYHSLLKRGERVTLADVAKMG